MQLTHHLYHYFNSLHNVKDKILLHSNKVTRHYSSFDLPAPVIISHLKRIKM